MIRTIAIWGEGEHRKLLPNPEERSATFRPTMRRLFIAFLALTAISDVRIPTLGPPQDFNDAVILSNFIFVP